MPELPPVPELAVPADAPAPLPAAPLLPGLPPSPELPPEPVVPPCSFDVACPLEQPKETTTVAHASAPFMEELQSPRITEARAPGHDERHGFRSFAGLRFAPSPFSASGGMLPDIDPEPNPSVFLLSPARLDGQRGALLTKATANFELARALRSPEGAPLADVFSFVSGLYFRGKVAYAREFGRARGRAPAAYVLTAGGGLCGLDEHVTLARLERWANVVVNENNPHFTAPLVRTASEALAAHDAATRFVLLGSVATNKYVAPLLDVFGERIFFPEEFAGLGDKSRGALLLAAAREHRELAYAPLHDRDVSLQGRR